MALTFQLEIGGKKKTFVAQNPKARVVRTAMDVSERAQSGLSTEVLDEMVDLVTEIFSHKFTADDVWDGVDADKLVPEVVRVINEVGEGMNKRIAEIPNVTAAK